MIDAYGRFMARALGLEGQVKFVAAGGAAKQIAALRAGRLDASTSEYFPIAALKCEGVVREVIGIRSFLPKEWTDLIVFARNDSVNTSPALVKKVVTGILQGAAFVQNNRAWAVKKMKSVAGYSESCARDSYGFLKYGKDGRIDPKVISNVRRFIIDTGLIAEEKFPPVNKLYTNRITG
jgi:ABC-type nitrate/sulfonate/bicarbonate transport system substrate-binding protein